MIVQANFEEDLRLLKDYDSQNIRSSHSKLLPGLLSPESAPPGCWVSDINHNCVLPFDIKQCSPDAFLTSVHNVCYRGYSGSMRSRGLLHFESTGVFRMLY